MFLYHILSGLTDNNTDYVLTRDGGSIPAIDGFDVPSARSIGNNVIKGMKLGRTMAKYID